MNQRQLAILFLGVFVIVFAGNGLIPVLPLFAAQLGADPGAVGLYMASTQAAFVIGAVLTGRLAERMSRRRLFLLAGIPGIVAFFLLGQATALWQAVLLTDVLWFSGAVGLTLLNLFTGLIASGKSRATAFMVLNMASPLGAIAGGFAVGGLITWSGYPLMFAVLGLTWIALPLIGLFGLGDGRLERPGALPGGVAESGAAALNRPFYVLLLASFLVSLALAMARLTLYSTMEQLAYTPAMVSSTTMVSGLVVLPLSLVFGLAADRLGRQALLMMAYLVAGLGAAVLIAAGQLWLFHLVAIFTLLPTTVNGGIAAALATDVLPARALGRGMSWLGAGTFLAGIVGFGAAGYLTIVMGTGLLMVMSAVVAVVAALLLNFSGVEERGDRPVPVPPVKALC